jgi:hypothetical protein
MKPTMAAPLAPACSSRPLDAAVLDAIADPDLAGRCAREPVYARALIEEATHIAGRAFDDGDDGALDVAHRTLYHLYSQAMWSPVDAPRHNEHDLTLAAVLLELEHGFQRQLGRVPMPDDPPPDAEAFAAWLSDLALVNPPLDDPGFGPYLRDHATLDQLREIVAQRSLFFLKEPDPWAMVIPSLRGEAKAGLIDVLLDEYGWGRYDHMHSTVYERLMDRLGLETGYDAYLERTSWQFLAIMNYQGMLARHRRLCRRMYGYIYLVEAESPAAMRTYLATYDRLGVTDPDVRRFYDLHVTADADHQRVALDEMIVPVVRAEPEARHEIARGVVGGQFLEHAFAVHLLERFRAGETSLRETGGR